VEFAELGSGAPILYFHGTGAAGDLVFRLEHQLVAAGFRLIVPNRPGYGRTPLEGNESVAGCGDLAAELLTTLGIPRSAVMGSSGGGLFAAAFASRHSERTSCLVLECAQIHRWDDPHWVPVASRWTLPFLRRAWLRGWLLRSYRWQMRLQTPQKFLAFQAGARFPAVQNDTGALELCRETLESMRRCLRNCAGFENDFVLFLNESGLGPGSVVRPTLVIHDPADPMAPVAHADWACECVPSAERCCVEAGGHIIWFGRDAGVMHDRRASFLRTYCT
jgi:pimeloyl-ACP methyl ester carboxylesterase